MKVKKEVFESLRLELQEFVPQEFIATCYYFVCIGNSINGKYLSVNNSQNKPGNVSQISHNDSQGYKVTSRDVAPTFDIRYVWDTYTPKNGHVSGYNRTVYLYNGHISANSTWTESLDRPNVSG